MSYDMFLNLNQFYTLKLVCHERLCFLPDLNNSTMYCLLTVVDNTTSPTNNSSPPDDASSLIISTRRSSGQNKAIYFNNILIDYLEISTNHLEPF